MTYDDGKIVVISVPELGVGAYADDGDYVKLEGNREGEGSDLCCWTARFAVVRYWAMLFVLSAVLVLLAVVLVKWVGPYVMDKELIPIINWEMTTFTTPELAVLLFASLALFPTLLLPSSPSMWVAGMTFGYGYGFLLSMSAVTVGVSLPYFISSLFLHKIQGWLEKYPKKAAILRSAGEGNWFHQFRFVALIRISPFPYIIYNYCAIATDVKYGPYMLGSVLGMVPEAFIAIYTGILIRTLADASHEQRSLSGTQIVLNVCALCATVVTAVIATKYAKRKLNSAKDEPLLS